MLVLGVALRKESVDRNGLLPKNTTGTPSSLSARRAWIEISILRGEGLIPPSLSARRAWIEIFSTKKPVPASIVALRKESVDRNFDRGVTLPPHERRSPQGERG